MCPIYLIGNAFASAEAGPLHRTGPRAWSERFGDVHPISTKARPCTAKQQLIGSNVHLEDYRCKYLQLSFEQRLARQVFCMHQMMHRLAWKALAASALAFA